MTTESARRSVALVSGASRGIGRAIAEHLHSMGYEVFGTATSKEGAEAISEALGPQHGLVCRLHEPETIDSVVSSVLEQATQIDVLVNNAGITRDQLLMRLKDDDWQAVIDANLTGSMRLSRACLRPMIKARSGRLIHISSVVASTGNPGQTNYAAAKAGLEGFSRALALEVASRGITSNVVAPGFIVTDMTDQLTEQQRESLEQQIPAQRLGMPEDVAAAVSFLASPQAGYITGQTIHVNGGMYLN